jgi:hypothetical protein
MGKQCLGCEIPVAKSFQTQIKGERTRKPWENWMRKKILIDVISALGGYEGDRFYIRNIQLTY